MSNEQVIGFSTETLQRLRQMELFVGLSEEDLVRWAAKFRREHHHRGAEVIRQAERSTAFYIVDRGELRGRVRSNGEDALRAYFYPGDFFGETGLLAGEPRNVTIDVLSDATLLVLDKLDFDHLMAEHSDVREKLRLIARQREESGRTRFPWQRSDEVTLFFSTKHWMALVHEQRSFVLLALLGVLATWLYLRVQLPDLLSVIMMLVAGTLLALAVLAFFYNVLDWRNDHYIITNRRVLHIERVLMLREERDEAPIERVQDVQVVQEGVWARLLDFGDVVIQTAAATQKIVFADVPRPEWVREALFAPLQYVHTRERAEMREVIRQELEHRLNIPGVSPMDGGGSGRAEEPLTVAEHETQEGPGGAAELLDWLGRFGRWLRGAFAFETRIVTDGGNTITWRKNGWILVRMSLAPIIVWLFILFLLIFSVNRSIGTPAVPLICLTLLVFIFGWWFYAYWDWQNDIYQVSGNRLIDLKRRPLFMEEYRRETTLDRIENISLSIPSVLAQLFNYGTVIIETAGETGAFEFEYVHDPRSVQAEIFSLRERHTQQRQQAETERRHGEFAEWFEIYEELKQKHNRMETSEGVIGDGVETDSIVG